MGLRLLPWVVIPWVLASAVGAYVLKSEHVLQLMLEKNSLPARLQVSQTVSVFDPEVDFMTADYEEQVFLQIPDQFRAEIVTEGFQRIQAAASGRVLTILDGRVIAESAVWTDHYRELFAFRDRRRLAERLSALGINMPVSSLGRFEGKICFVLGADYPDETVPQIWVDKETFLPLRWIVAPGAGDGGKKREILFYDWQNHHRTWYPGRMEFLEDQRPVKRIQVRQVALNPSFAKDFFDLDRLKGIYGAQILEEEPGEGRDISRQIEEFKKIYR